MTTLFIITYDSLVFFLIFMAHKMPIRAFPLLLHTKRKEEKKEKKKERVFCIFKIYFIYFTQPLLQHILNLILYFAFPTD